MALIPCPNCNNSVSDSAISCPHCKLKIYNQLKSTNNNYQNKEYTPSSNNYNYQNSSTNLESSTHNKINYFAIICACCCIIAVFLPWFKLSSSASYMGFNAHYNSNAISGFKSDGGKLSILLSIVAIILAIKDMGWIFLMAIVNLIIGIGYALGWFESEGSYSYNGYGLSAKASLDPQIGLYIFIIASLLLAISSMSSFSDSKDE